MPTETEELRLVVSLTDNATDGIARLRSELTQLGSGQNKENIERFKRETDEMSRKMRGMGTAAGSAFKDIGLLNVATVALGTGLGQLGAQLATSILNISGFADRIRSLRQEARAIGADPISVENIIKQFEAVGVSGETTMRNLRALSQSIGELFRPGNQLQRDLMNMAGGNPQAQAAMLEFIEKLKTARTEEERTNLVLEAQRNVRANAFGQYKSQQEAALRANELLQKFGLDPSITALKSLNELGEEERKRAAARQKEMEEYANLLGQVVSKWEDVRNILAQPLLRGFINAMDELYTIVKGIVSALEWIEKKFGGGETGEGGDPMGRFVKKFREQMGDPRNWGFNPMSFTPGVGGSGAGGGFGGLLQPAAFTPGATYGGGGYGGYGGGGGYGGAPMGYGARGADSAPAAPGGSGGAGYGKPTPYGSDAGGGDPSVPSDILARAKLVAIDGGPQAVAQFMAQQGYPKAGNWCGEFAASVVKSVGGTPPKGAAVASNWRNWGTPVDTPQPGDIAVRRGVQTGSTGSHVTIVESVDPKTGSFRGLGGNQGSTISRYGIGRYEFRRGGAGGDAGLGAATGSGLSRSAYDKMFGGTPLAGQYDTVVSEAAKAGIDPSLLAGVMAHETAAGTSRMLRERLNPAGLMDPKTGMMAGKTFGSIEEGIAAAGKAVSKNLQRGGGTIEGLGSIYAPPGAANDPRGQNRGWAAGVRSFMSRLGEDRQQIDRSQTATTKVEGTGKLSVDVKAPKGTQVDASGGGLFKQTEINRQTQMEPARRGPVPTPEETFAL
jgi:uncharacterized protein (TIGR02594 family)